MDYRFISYFLKMNERQKYYYDQVKLTVEARGGKVLSDRFITLTGNKMWFLCEHGHTWDTEARSILKNSWCRFCYGRTKAQGEENFCRRVTEKGGKVIGKYQGSHVPIEVECEYGHRWHPVPNNITSGKWCDVCGYIDEEAKEKFHNMVKSKGGTVIGEYINTRTKTKILCSQHHEWDPKPNWIMNGRWCPTCAGLNPDVAKEKFHRIIEEKGGKLLTPYVNAKTKCLIQCKNLHQWEKKPRYINAGDWCRECAYIDLNASHKHNELLQQRGWELRGSYVNCRTLCQYICDKGHNFEDLPRYILSGAMCPKCGGSKGEQLISKVLDDMGIKYDREYVLPILPCRKYDFIISHNDKYYLIEFDGIQHFEFVDFFHMTPEVFAHKQEIDRIKTYVPLMTGYNLIRMDYTLLKSTDPTQQFNNIKNHIISALKSDSTIYVTTNSLYDGWLLGSPVDINVIEEEAPELFNGIK
jgi:hypothetical protein